MSSASSSRLAGKIALVSAAAQGIGRATAEAFAREGASVWATDINEVGLGVFDGMKGVQTRRLDVLDGGAVSRLIAEIGSVDILFNCAGIVHSGTVLEAKEAELDFAFDLNVKSMMRMIQGVLPGMLAKNDGKGDGVIINMASVASSLKAVPNRFVYCTTKAAVIGLTKSVAADYVARGIRCNAICPGTIESPSLQDRLRSTGNYEKAKADFIARQPVGRIGQPEEIADLAVYLATAKFTTAQVQIIDGGWAA